MDIRETVYKSIEEKGGVYYKERKELIEALSQANTDALTEDLDRFYRAWFDVQQIEEYTEERARLEYIQETCFEVACQALALQGDPSVIRHFLKYVPVDEYDGSTVSMEDYNVQHLLDCISDKDYYGEGYIPVLLAHIHELIPDKMVEARGFLRTMIWDDFNEFDEDQPLFSNLQLAQPKPFLELLEYCMKRSLEELTENDPEQAKRYTNEGLDVLEDVDADSPHFFKLLYLQQEFLKLHASD